jgi:hypothetical protein
MVKFKLTIYETDTRNQEKIKDIQFFKNRYDLENFIDKIKIEPKPYKLPKGEQGWVLSAE